MTGIFDAFLAEFDRRSRSRRTGIRLAALTDAQLEEVGLTRTDVAGLIEGRRAIDDGRRGGIGEAAGAGLLRLAALGRGYPQTR
ncbi:DUF1127 domain-containing protein [Methylobrevis albus]|uniref:DUF1127 domain-containing protein n=1 Tax=Methylobrevis albus TaxID=2793297 RepID=A0A931N019_9HYPH|nr:DUF1127 domain-containing protein [Methylobrevis albus]MBH0238331.1 DUF1127 domain-containing protein [Methylobrevis albus]